MHSNFDRFHLNRPAFSSRHPGLPFNGAFAFLPSPLFHQIAHPIPVRQLTTFHHLHLPVEIFTDIFLYAVQADPRCQANLMLVCRHWRDVMLSTPGIHSQLRIGRWTETIDVERFGRRWLLDVTVDTGSTPGAPKFYACFMAAAEAASRWRSFALLSLPPPGEYKDLKIMHPLQHLESFKLATSCNLGNFLEPLLNAITTTVTLALL